MQKSVAIVLIIAAFLAGALADRVYRWANAESSAYVQLPVNPNANPANDPGTWDMKGCMASAQRRGMSDQEATHACQEIIR